MTTTPDMNLVLPDPSITLGPLWAQLLNAALTLVDSHDHAPGNGTKVSPTGLNINSDLPFNSHSLRSGRLLELVDEGSSPADLDVIYRVGTNLYWNNSSGFPVQITSGNLVNAPGNGVISVNVVLTYPYTVLAADAQKVLIIDTSSARTVNLDTALDGIFLMVKDGNNNAQTNNITINPNGGDTIDGLNAPYLINWNNGSIGLVSDGISKWYVV